MIYMTKKELSKKVNSLQCDFIVLENRLGEVELKLAELLKPKKAEKKPVEKKAVKKVATKKAK